MSKPLASSGDLLFPVTEHSYTRANAEAMRRAILSPSSAIREGRRCPRPNPPDQAALPGHGPEHEGARRSSAQTSDNHCASARVTAKVAVGRGPLLCVTAWTLRRQLGFGGGLRRLLPGRDERLSRREIVTMTCALIAVERSLRVCIWSLFVAMPDTEKNAVSKLPSLTAHGPFRGHGQRLVRARDSAFHNTGSHRGEDE